VIDKRIKTLRKEKTVQNFTSPSIKPTQSKAPRPKKTKKKGKMANKDILQEIYKSSLENSLEIRRKTPNKNRLIKSVENINK